MTLPAAPPKYMSWSTMLASIKKGEAGWRPYALQAALRTAGRQISADGVFGESTLRVVRAYQGANNLTVDGIVGPSTQKSLLAKASAVVHKKIPKLPDGVLRGFAESEGANLLAATNWYTPPNGDPGVDCGPVQWRQYGPPFSVVGLRMAFDVEQSFMWASNNLLDRMTAFHKRRPSLTQEMLLRLALLAHNAPFLAEQVVRTGALTTPNALATWTTKPGGGAYTHQEWFSVYPDRLMRYVK